MEDIRSYRNDEEEARRISEDDRKEYSAASADDEVPFHIPRD
ncbi:MAG TPA: hypothetical protein VF215_08155 [Thermoanaerobaculia bacterium]